MREVRRRSLVGLLLGAAAGCAHVEAPPGGPEITDPPDLLITRPEAGAVVPRYDGPVVFVFDDRISERGVEEAVVVSPRTSPVQVRHGRDEIRVSLRQGWQPGIIYHVTLLPGLQDLFNNRITETIQLVFSTGPEIPETRASGTVIDRISGRPEDDIRIEAIRTADSLVYSTFTTREGEFELASLPEGEFQLRAFDDINRNRRLDPFEPRDSAFVTVREGEPLAVELRLLMPDSTPPALTAATARDRRIELRFDDYLDPEQTVTPEQVEILDAQGRRLAVQRVAVGNLPPAPDPADPIDAADPADPADPPPADPDQPGAAAATPPDQQPPGQDDAVDRPAPLPSRDLIVEVAEDDAPAAGESYRITVRAIRNVNGLVGDSEYTLEMDPPPEQP